MKKLILFTFMFLVACGQAPVAVTSTPVPPTPVPSPTITLTPFPTFTPLPTLTPTITPDPNVLVDEKGVDMRLVPAGEFIVGVDIDEFTAACRRQDDHPAACNYSADDILTPPRQIYLDAYFMDVYEVTNARYSECVDAGACTPPAIQSFQTISEYYGNPEYNDYPVVYVDHTQAQTYCAWRGGSLPTEAQWEKAARGSQGFYFPWGNDMIVGAANFCDKSCDEDATYDDGFGLVAPVGSFEGDKSPYGMYDMAGNVFEWTADYYARDYFETMPDSNPTGPASGNHYVIRGSRYDYPGDLFNPIIFGGDYRPPTFNSWVLGFRCARGANP